MKYQIHMQGLTMAQVAAAVGVDRRTLYQVFRKPYPRMEKVVAEALGMTPQVLFPERYDADGLPNRMMGRPQKSITKTVKNNTGRKGRNVQADTKTRQEAA
ncbi:MAG: helix-turn-helix domain-containing protein [Porticoccaceae bacterium]